MHLQNLQHYLSGKKQILKNSRIKKKKKKKFLMSFYIYDTFKNLMPQQQKLTQKQKVRDNDFFI